MVKTVVISAQAQKDLRKAPMKVREKLAVWVDDVATWGLPEVRKVRGYNDEALKGKRKGQRSIRLNLQWRAIYELGADGEIEFVEVLEVTPHKY